MSFFYKITYSEDSKRLNIYNFGCNFNCKICTYKIKSPYNGEAPIEVREIKSIIKTMHKEKKLKIVNFLGGEPTTNPYLDELISFANSLGLRAQIGHTNGTKLIPGVDSMTISIKAITPDLHIDYTGVSNQKILENIRTAHKIGIKLKTNTVFVPCYVDLKEIEKIAKFISTISTLIPLHIIGYIPVPGLHFRAPDKTELTQAVKIAKTFLQKVTFTLNSSVDEISYPSKRIL